MADWKSGARASVGYDVPPGAQHRHPRESTPRWPLQVIPDLVPLGTSPRTKSKFRDQQPARPDRAEGNYCAASKTPEKGFSVFHGSSSSTVIPRLAGEST